MISRLLYLYMLQHATAWFTRVGSSTACHVWELLYSVYSYIYYTQLCMISFAATLCFCWLVVSFAKYPSLQGQQLLQPDLNSNSGTPTWAIYCLALLCTAGKCTRSCFPMSRKASSQVQRRPAVWPRGQQCSWRCKETRTRWETVRLLLLFAITR